MKTVEEQKKELRQLFKHKRLELQEQDVQSKSQEIAQNFIDNLLTKIYHKNSQKIFSLYLPSYHEVNTDNISQHFFRSGIKFCYPKITKPNQPLSFIEATLQQSFTPCTFFPKILEPQGDKELIPDFIIMPLLAFDDNLNRLGMGGGFFDRTIASLKKQNFEIITIGLAYRFQRSEKIIPTENTDQKLDFIVTEKNIFSAT